ncbi:MAG: universal stress protein [Burkholderiales bacterium]|nr:universal stress protein [Burkholderiales bacterium]
MKPNPPLDHYRHILAGIDFADASRFMAGRAADLARRYGARLTLLHVIEHFPQEVTETSIPPEDVDPARFFLAEARRRIAELAIEIGFERAEPQVLLSAHSARYEILRIARESNIDLIAVGARGPGMLHHLLGSTASGVFSHAHCDVIVVQPGAGARRT